MKQRGGKYDLSIKESTNQSSKGVLRVFLTKKTIFKKIDETELDETGGCATNRLENPQAFQK